MRRYESQKLSTVFFADRDVSVFKRSGRYHLAEKGRWGPAWLHRLLLKAARNLGMIRHEVIRHDQSEVVKVEQIDYRRDIEDQISDALIEWIDQGWGVEGLEVVCGQRWLTDFKQALRRPFELEYPVNVSKRDGGRTLHWRGVRMRVVPNLEGWAILPLP